jgi:hypothetical protein
MIPATTKDIYSSGCAPVFSSYQRTAGCQGFLQQQRTYKLLQQFGNQSFSSSKGLQDVSDSCNNKGHISFCNILATKAFVHPKGLQDVNDPCNNKGHISFCNNLATKAYAFGNPKGLQDVNDSCNNKGHIFFRLCSSLFVIPKDCRMSRIPATTKDI